MNINIKRRLLLYLFVVVAALFSSYFIRKAVNHFRSLQSRELQFTVSIKDTSKGYLLLSPYVPSPPYFSMLVIMDLDGNIIIKKHVEGIVSDFRQWNIEGHIRYSYAVYDPGNDPGDFIHGSMAHAIIMDSALNEIKQVRLLSHDDVVAGKTDGIDHHDMIMLSDDHFITMASYVKAVSNIPYELSPASNVRVIAPIIQEIKNDTVIWQWDGTRFPELYESSNKNNKFSDSVTTQDYLHINAMLVDPHDSNLIVSFHNSNQLIKINRHNGNIIWRLGGRNSDFPLTADEIFLRQHHPTFVDSGKTLLLFDNGDSVARPVSRVLEFRLDENAKKITSFKGWNIPGPFADSKGSVQLVGSDYVICGGSANYVLKVNRVTGVKKMEMHYNQTSFRACFVRDISGIKQAGKENRN